MVDDVPPGDTADPDDSLWCTKLGLLALYARMFSSMEKCKKAAKILEIVLYVTFVAILFPTLLECRPIALYVKSESVWIV